MACQPPVGAVDPNKMGSVLGFRDSPARHPQNLSPLCTSLHDEPAMPRTPLCPQRILRIRHVCLSALVALITTVVVAWAFAMTHPQLPDFSPSDGRTLFPGGGFWMYTQNTKIGVARVYSEFGRPMKPPNRAKLPTSTSAVRHPPAESVAPSWFDPKYGQPDREGMIVRRYTRAYGFPFLAFRWDRVEVLLPDSAGTLRIAVDVPRAGGFELHRAKGGDKFVLPIIPILPNFLFNWIAYWILSLGLILVVRRFIRGHRRARNACQACGYCMIGLSGSRCPECGSVGPLLPEP